MTYIEFFDKDAVENICSGLINPPDQIVLVGDKAKEMAEHARRYEKIFAERGHQVVARYRGINRNNLGNIVDTLSDIVENWDDCVFDLTGGDELYLVALGIVYARYPEKKIRMHRINIRNNTLIDCDQDGVTIFDGELPPITVRENIRIYGGDIVYDDVKEGGTHRWDMTEEFRADIGTMWEICREDPREWNRQIGVLVDAEECLDGGAGSLTTVAPAEKVPSRYGNRFGEQTVIRALLEAGLITELRVDENLTVTYKDEQVKRCLVKAGQVLEMKVLSAAMNCREKDGAPTYDDAVNGVMIDWDGVMRPGRVDTENEIDVLMTHGMVPVFVSCKNGYVEVNELFKLNTVAEQFGGKYAKKVLIVSELDEDDPHTKALRQRADDMDIRIVANLKHTSDSELERVIRSLWLN